MLVVWSLRAFKDRKRGEGCIKGKIKALVYTGHEVFQEQGSDTQKKIEQNLLILVVLDFHSGILNKTKYQ